MTNEPSPLEILLLADAGDVQDLAIAYGTAQLYATPVDRETLLAITADALLNLLDRGLILFFVASRDEGYNADPANVNQLGRDDVVQRLGRDRDPTYVPSEGELMFFTATPAGRELFHSIPKDSVPQVAGRVTRDWKL